MCLELFPKLKLQYMLAKVYQKNLNTALKKLTVSAIGSLFFYNSGSFSIILSNG